MGILGRGSCDGLKYALGIKPVYEGIIEKKILLCCYDCELQFSWRAVTAKLYTLYRSDDDRLTTFN